MAGGAVEAAADLGSAGSKIKLDEAVLAATLERAGDAIALEGENKLAAGTAVRLGGLRGPVQPAGWPMPGKRRNGEVLGLAAVGPRLEMGGMLASAGRGAGTLC